MEADELGSGGKIVRRRKAAAADSPYFRPRLPSHSPTPNSIFSRLASGAGKVLSSIFHGGSSSPSRFSSSDDEIDDEDGMDGDIIADSNEVKGLSEQEAATPMTNNDRAVVNQLIFQKSEAKFAKLKKLLAQETFSREECNRLVKIIQSRVVDCPPLKVNDLENGQNDAHARAIGSKTASVRTWWSLPATRKSFVPFTFSNNSVNASSPGGFGLQADGLHLHNAAIMKARRWIEEKKLESTLKSTMDNGPCTLNTDILTHITENAMASPVGMAKLYMRTRPSWASPCLSDIGFRTPSPLGMQLYKDETPYTVDNYSLPSLKALEVDKKKKEHSESYVSHNCHTSGLMPMEPSDKLELSVEALNSEPEVLLDKEVKAQKNVDNATNPCDAPSSHSCIIETTLETISSQPHQLFGHKDMDPGFDFPETVVVINRALPGIYLQDGCLYAASFRCRKGGALGYNENIVAFPCSKQEMETYAADFKIKMVSSDQGSRSGVEDDMLQKETNRLGSKFDANSSVSLKFSMSGLKDGDAVMTDPNTERVVDGKLSHGNSIETCELLSEASIDVPSVNETNSNIDGLENDCNEKSDEKMGLQPEEMLRALKRGKKAGGYYRRFKGKGSSGVKQRST